MDAFREKIFNEIVYGGSSVTHLILFFKTFFYYFFYQLSE